MKIGRMRLGVLITLALCLFVVGAGSIGGAERQESLVEVEGALADIANLSTLPRLSLRAHFVISVRRGVDSYVTGEATYALLRDGERFWVKSSSDRALGFAGDFEYSYDGDISYFLREDSGLLSVKSGPPERTPTSLPSPLLLPFELLGFEDYCAACGVDVDPYELRRLIAGHLQGGGAVERNEDRITARLPSASRSDWQLEVIVEDTDKSSPRLRDIQLRSENGHPVARLALDGFVTTTTSSGTVEAPSVIELSTFAAGDSAPSLHASITIRELREWSDSSSESFVIPASRASSIWDADREEFLVTSHSPRAESDEVATQ
jgi:hypothetical protein